MPEVGDVFQEVFFVEAKPPEANDIAAAQAEAVNATSHLELSAWHGGCQLCHCKVPCRAACSAPLANRNQPHFASASLQHLQRRCRGSAINSLSAFGDSAVGLQNHPCKTLLAARPASTGSSHSFTEMKATVGLQHEQTHKEVVTTRWSEQSSQSGLAVSHQLFIASMELSHGHHS